MSDLSVTAASVAWVSGTKAQLGTCGETITAGEGIYTDGVSWFKAKANVAGKQNPSAVSLTGGTVGLPLLIAPPGAVINCGATVVANTPYYNSGANAGGVAPFADITTGWAISYVWVAETTANVLVLCNN